MLDLKKKGKVPNHLLEEKKKTPEKTAKVKNEEKYLRKGKPVQFKV